ncbi:hypothetical protein F511_33358 [Dorcoceras hygrometricum]|uniref:Uncharacterized protein n=1 Tax=Dorcoceras hygrometricum TaxID=472368 RepID=A0A2Z7C8K9_9LAMI|nr:hypothetical protein F511_33358 [Dorcoceras hygrometricum]
MERQRFAFAILDQQMKRSKMKRRRAGDSADRLVVDDVIGDVIIFSRWFIQQEDFVLIIQQSQHKDIQAQDEVADASNSSIQSRAYLNQLLLYIQVYEIQCPVARNPGAKNRRSSKAQIAFISTADESVSSCKDISTVDESISSRYSRSKEEAQAGAGVMKISWSRTDVIRSRVLVNLAELTAGVVEQISCCNYKRFVQLRHESTIEEKREESVVRIFFMKSEPCALWLFWTLEFVVPGASCLGCRDQLGTDFVQAEDFRAFERSV